MEILLAIDLSTKPGYAIFHGRELKHYDTIFPKREYKDAGKYPLNYLALTEEIVCEVLSLIPLSTINVIQPFNLNVVLEETTASQSNYSQKKLEFLHCLLLYELRELGIVPMYVRDGVWKDMVGARQINSEKNHNARISRQKKKKKDKFKAENPDAEKIPAFRASIKTEDGRSKVLRRLDEKDYSIRAVKEHFGIELSREQEDTADAINIGWALLHGAPLCDGTPDGGLRSKEDLFIIPKPVPHDPQT